MTSVTSEDEIKTALEPYVRSREETLRIRRILAAHLNSCREVQNDTAPLSLADTSCTVTQSQEVRGLQREYLKALDANVKAQHSYQSVREEAPLRKSGPASQQRPPASNPLEEHLGTLKLQKKQSRLHAIDQCLTSLGQQPAASSDFLDAEQIFKDAKPLPQVPKQVVDGFTIDGEAGKSDLKHLIGQLEKLVLRAKLLLRKEEHLLEDIRSRSSSLPSKISEEAKLKALSITRDELIAWIEAELANAPAEEEAEDTDILPNPNKRTATEQASIDQQLARIKEAYAEYIRSRKSLLQTISQKPQPIMKPQTAKPEPAMLSFREQSKPVTHLLTPYLDSLLAVAHEQKGFIAQKSHLNVTLAKQLKSAGQILDHLAEESQLLPSFPLPTAARRKGLGEGLAPADSGGASSRANVWVYAADSAKIATLEAVAEQIEEGQVALEGSMKILGELDQLLGTGAKKGPEVEVDTTEDDIWLAQSNTGAAQRRHTDKKADKVSDDGDIWCSLQGSLGLIGPDDDSIAM